jgi:hypothetical protein
LPAPTPSPETGPRAGHAPWTANPPSTVDRLVERFSRVTYRGTVVGEIRAAVDADGTIRLYGTAVVGRRRVQVQAYEVITHQGRVTVTSLFWGQLDQTSAADPRLAFEEGLYPHRQDPEPDVDFITAWSTS